MEKRDVKKALILVVTGLVLIGFLLMDVNIIHPSNPNDLGLEYYEDIAGNMGLEEVQEKLKLGMFQSHNKKTFSFGRSSSTYWIRIPLKENRDAYKDFVSVYNPTVTKAILYMPVDEDNAKSYKKLSSGWRFGQLKEDEGFFYPVFQWDKKTDFKRDAYIQLYSRFTQNYRINFLNSDEFEENKRNNLLLHGIVFGALLAVVIQNFIVFWELKDKATLYFGFYIVLMIIYQGNLLGIYNMFIPEYCNLIMANTITISIVTMVSVILFYREFFRTKNVFYTYDKILKLLIVLVFAGIFFTIADQFVLANLYAHGISNLGSVFMMYVAIQAHRKGVEQAKLFILGWSFMILSLGVSLLRHTGWIPNNIITINITFIAVALQSILLSTALVKLVKILAKEKEKVLRQYKDAEENAELNEMAFLHAQIKPHFLYNALNVIISLCRIDAEKARGLLLDLSGFLRHTFDFDNQQKLVYLKDELEYVQAYVRIEQARFRNKLNVIYEFDETPELKIPPLTIQPLVENAIVHGIRKKSSVGKIVLRVMDDLEGYRIEVEDDGLGMKKEQIDRLFSQHEGKRGVGLENINKRLTKFYGQGLRIESVPQGGTKVSMVIGKKGEVKYADGYTD